MERHVFLAGLILAAFFLFNGCSNYGFTGGSLGSEIKTINIKSFPNRAETINPQLRDIFRRNLEEEFLSGTNLELVDSDGDITLDGAITRYQVEPVGTEESGRASRSRLVMTVNVKFTNLHDEDDNFEENFSHNEEFDASQSFRAVEDQLMQQVSIEIAEQIFRRVVMDW